MEELNEEKDVIKVIEYQGTLYWVCWVDGTIEFLCEVISLE